MQCRFCRPGVDGGGHGDRCGRMATRGGRQGGVVRRCVRDCRPFVWLRAAAMLVRVLPREEMETNLNLPMLADLTYL